MCCSEGRVGSLLVLLVPGRGLAPHGCSEAGMAEERTKTILVDRRADEAIFVVYAVVHLVQETLWCTYRDGDAL